MANAKAYDKGYRAGKRGVLSAECPYHKATSRQAENHALWMAGWKDAMIEKAPKNECPLGYMQGRGAA